MSARPPARSVDSCPRTPLRMSRRLDRAGRLPVRLAARAVEDRPLHRRLARLADRDRGPAPVARLARRPCTCPGGRPSVDDRCSCRRATAQQPRGSATCVGRRPRPEPLREQGLGREDRADARRRPSGRAAPRRPASTRGPPSAAAPRRASTGLAEDVRPEVADERALVAGAHDVEHAQVVPDRGPVGGGQHGADAAAPGPPPPATPCARSASSPPCAGACAASGRRRTG